MNSGNQNKDISKSEESDVNSSSSSILKEDETPQQYYERENNYLLLIEKMNDLNFKNYNINKNDGRKNNIVDDTSKDNSIYNVLFHDKSKKRKFEYIDEKV